MWDAPKASAGRPSTLPPPGSPATRTLRPLATALLAAGLVLALGAPAWAAGDPLNGLVEVITQNAQRWSAALMIVGGLGAGGSMVLGHHQSGDHARRFLFGSLFLLAAGAGVQMYSRMQSLLGGF
ncbi:MAG TPA: hypothetical protein VKI41_05555 [Vicinamibacteria bacterium]|nr:hypothetical protein [Vicinamibacteria bacterium]